MPNETQHLLRIGELSSLTKVSTRTIRFYVEEGLLPKPVKTHRNMAYYDPECIPKIKAIKRAQSERFLPLVVIGQMLEKSGHDF
jgi:DNA-binding transcriptional MerR regulator